MIVAAIPKRFTYAEIMAISRAAEAQAADLVRDMFVCSRNLDGEGFYAAHQSFHRAMARADAWALAAAKHAANSALDVAKASISTSNEVSHAKH